MSNKVTIQHSIPGRVRFKVPDIRADKKVCCRLEQDFKGEQGILWVRVSPKSASLVVRYDAALIGPAELMGRLRKSIIGDKKAATTSCPCNVRSCAEHRGESLKSSFRRFIAMSFLAGYVLVRHFLLKKPLAQNLLSPLGIVATLAALPLVKKGIAQLRSGHVALESFLGAAVVAAVAAGEALAALEILWVTSAGDLLQTWITERSRRAIRDILQLTEKNTYILVNGVELSVAVNQVQPGDTVVLHTGEKVAVDGEIIRGEALLDESPITGCADPVVKTIGDQVLAGTLVRQGVIYVRATEVGDRTYMARILRMVEESLENKAPIEGVADRLAQKMIKAGFAVTLGTLVLTRSVWRAFAVMLVMACPCATILAASTAISAALNTAARRHILIKGGRYLEEVSSATVICFDKTGTLTTNQPQLIQLVNLDGLPENELLQLAYSTEIHNSHPVALAIKSEAEKRGITPIHHEVCEYFLGKGVRSEIHGDEILVGSHKLMEQFAVNPERVKGHLEDTKKQGLTLVFIARNRVLLGVAAFANQDRSDVESVITFFRKDGIKKTAMITGDSKYSALEMASRLNFDDCRYSVLPEEKAAIVAGLRNGGNKVLMVGDGINDALALAEADIGVVMGAGSSEVAIEAADIALVKDDLTGLVYVRSLSRTTIKVIYQNFWIATGSNIAGLVLGALGLMTPVAAGLVHIVHTLGILANSSRLLHYDPGHAFPNSSLSSTSRLEVQPQRDQEQSAASRPHVAAEQSIHGINNQ